MQIDTFHPGGTEEGRLLRLPKSNLERGGGEKSHFAAQMNMSHILGEIFILKKNCGKP